MTPNEFISEIQPFVDDKILAITDTNGKLPKRISELAVEFPLEGFQGMMQTSDGSSYVWNLYKDHREEWIFKALLAN